MADFVVNEEKTYIPIPDYAYVGEIFLSDTDKYLLTLGDGSLLDFAKDELEDALDLRTRLTTLGKEIELKRGEFANSQIDISFDTPYRSLDEIGMLHKGDVVHLLDGDRIKVLRGNKIDVNSSYFHQFDGENLDDPDGKNTEFCFNINQVVKIDLMRGQTYTLNEKELEHAMHMEPLIQQNFEECMKGSKDKPTEKDYSMNELRQENDTAYSALRAAYGDQPVPPAWEDNILSPQQRDEMRAREIMKKVFLYISSKEDVYLNLRERIQTRSDQLLDIPNGVVEWMQSYVDTYFVHEKEKAENTECKSILPDGWKWHHYKDGSGCLEAPDGKSYFEYDLMTDEYKMEMDEDRWSYRDRISLRTFVLYAEDKVMEKLELEEREKIIEQVTKGIKREAAPDEGGDTEQSPVRRPRKAR